VKVRTFFLGVLGVISASCLTVERDSVAPFPDRVVGVRFECRIINQGNTVELESEEDCRRFVRSITSGELPGFVQRNAKILTVRTPSGSSYTVEVLPDHLVALGDNWPP